MRHVLAKPEVRLLATDSDDPESLSAVDLFADDWETNWADNWETDWREYLTEHPEVRLVTIDNLTYTIRYGQG